MAEAKTKDEEHLAPPSRTSTLRSSGGKFLVLVLSSFMQSLCMNHWKAHPEKFPEYNWFRQISLCMVVALPFIAVMVYLDIPKKRSYKDQGASKVDISGSGDEKAALPDEDGAK